MAIFIPVADGSKFCDGILCNSTTEFCGRIAGYSDPQFCINNAFLNFDLKNSFTANDSVNGVPSPVFRCPDIHIHGDNGILFQKKFSNSLHLVHSPLDVISRTGGPLNAAFVAEPGIELKEISVAEP
uniref:Uncharacterized protein n=1 Tax=Panagrolaimus davidi TaxID=227884 RepID=A0A914QDI1_9BILA